jgi:MFS superfamily sulfate permease-like transporter
MFKNLSNDLPAGLVVFLVAVPLCLGIALASGAPLFSGIISGIVGGIIVGAISHSKIGVSGPAAGLAVIVYDSIQRFGETPDGGFSMEQGFPLFLAALVLGGFIQMSLAFVKAGIIGYFFPNSVIKGMLTAIGIIIILKQIPHALGHDVIAEGFDGFNQADGENTFTELMVAMGDINPVAVIITVISLAILILWEQSFMKKIRVFQLIQGPLVVVVAGIILGKHLTGIGSFALEADEMVAIPIMSEEGGFTKLFTTPDFSQFFTSTTILAAFTIAVVPVAQLKYRC